MVKKYKNDDPEDIATFKEAVKGVKPLLQNKIRLEPTSSQIIKTNTGKKSQTDPFDLYEKDQMDLVTSEEFIAYKQDSISNKTLRKLRKGQYNVEAMLDLHGMTVNEAKKAVKDFLQDCLAEEVRVAIIIHGKGKQNMPILKNKLNQWLREVSFILAFCSAGSAHGRGGAVYILIKRQ